MQRTPFELDYRLRTLAPLRLPTGSAAGHSWLAGSLVKGAGRRSAVNIAALLNMVPCRADGDPQCTLCRLFGAPGLEAVLHWSPAAIIRAGPASEPGLGRHVRHRRPVNRTSGVSASEPDPARVALSAGLLFEGRLHGWLAGDGIADAAFVVAALHRLDQLGGGRASGHGRVGLTISSVRLGGEPGNWDELLSTLVVQEAV